MGKYNLSGIYVIAKAEGIEDPVCFEEAPVLAQLRIIQGHLANGNREWVIDLIKKLQDATIGIAEGSMSNHDQTDAFLLALGLMQADVLLTIGVKFQVAAQNPYSEGGNRG